MVLERGGLFCGARLADRVRPDELGRAPGFKPCVTEAFKPENGSCGSRPHSPSCRGTSGAKSPLSQGWQAIGHRVGSRVHSTQPEHLVAKTKPGTYAGIDVGSRELVVCMARGRGESRTLTIPNTAEGHRTLLRALTKGNGKSRVVLEATGTYHLDLALLLSASKGIELMVANPFATRRFADAQMRRAKTDKVDAAMLLLFCQTMPFEPWTPPRAAALELRGLSRHVNDLIAHATVIKNRIAASQGTTTTSAFLREDLASELTAIEARICKVEAEALRVAREDAAFRVQLACLDSVPGVGERTAIRLLGELCVLDQAMKPDEIVAHAGLDPRPRQSGMRDGPRRISKMGNTRIRQALYMPAVSASRGTGVVGELYLRLVGKGKPAFVAHVAVMRRLLRICWVVMTRQVQWDPTLFAPRQNLKSAA